MTQISPAGPVYQAGTMSGNPLAMAAGLATLGEIRQNDGFYDRLETLGRAARGRRAANARRTTGARASSRGSGSMWTLFFTTRPRDGLDVGRRRPIARRFGRFFHAMLAQGISLAPSQFEANFISAAHTSADIARTVDAVGQCLEGSRG